LIGKINEEVGKAIGDAKLETDGKADRVEGKTQNPIRSLKDKMKQKLVMPAQLRHWLNQPFFKTISLEAIRKCASGVRQRIGRLFPSAIPWVRSIQIDRHCSIEGGTHQMSRNTLLSGHWHARRCRYHIRLPVLSNAAEYRVH
jgi:uncharacterized protein YjbJ (UPF0337 family)